MERLRLIKRLMDQGHRPGKLLAATPEELASLTPRSAASKAQSNRSSDTAALDDLINLIRQLAAMIVADQPVQDQGFDNKVKRTLYERRALELATELEKLRKELEAHQTRSETTERRLLHCQTLANLQWSEVDVTSMLTRITSLQGQVKTELEAHPDLAALDEQIKKQAELHGFQCAHRGLPADLFQAPGRAAFQGCGGPGVMARR